MDTTRAAPVVATQVCWKRWLEGVCACQGYPKPLWWGKELCEIQAEKLLDQKGSGNDALLVTTWNRLGEQHADRQDWHKVNIVVRLLACPVHLPAALSDSLPHVPSVCAWQCL